MDYINIISKKIKTIKPYKAFIFGSHAYGSPDEESDIDIIVILNKTGFPKDYNEKMENHRIIRKLLRDINKDVALDIIVYTIDEWNKFISINSSFSRLILEKGRAIA